MIARSRRTVSTAPNFAPYTKIGASQCLYSRAHRRSGCCHAAVLLRVYAMRTALKRGRAWPCWICARRAYTDPSSVAVGLRSDRFPTPQSSGVEYRLWRQHFYKAEMQKTPVYFELGASYGTADRQNYSGAFFHYGAWRVIMSWRFPRKTSAMMIIINCTH